VDDRCFPDAAISEDEDLATVEECRRQQEGMIEERLGD
jgi:hypothetical protein